MISKQEKIARKNKWNSHIILEKQICSVCDKKRKQVAIMSNGLIDIFICEKCYVRYNND